MCVDVMLYVHVVICICVVFFFQAEDGIRDLVRSRGLGDVYKRQGTTLPGLQTTERAGQRVAVAAGRQRHPRVLPGHHLSLIHI